VTGAPFFHADFSMWKCRDSDRISAGNAFLVAFSELPSDSTWLENA